MMEKKGILLFVEDDKVDQMAFTRYVGKNAFPYDYVLAGSVKEAVAQLESATFDAVVLDYLLGDGTAFDLFEKISGAAIIMVTGKGDVEVAIKAMKAGVHDYLEKDPDGNYLALLATTVEKAILQQHEEEELANYRQHLEELVAERTDKLHQAHQLQQVINLLLQEALEHVSFDEYLKRTLAIVLSLPGYGLQGCGAIFLVDDDDQEALSMKVSLGLNKQQQEVCRKVPFGTCVCGRAALHRTCQSFDSDDDCHEIKLQGVLPHTHYGIPILAGEKFLGVISLYVENEKQKNPEKEKNFLMIARTLAGIIELYRSDEEKEILQNQLIEAQKIDTVGRLAGGIAHDFNNLLCAINGYAQLGMMNMAPDSEGKEYFEVIYNSGQRAADLTQQLLTFSRKKKIKPVNVNMNTIIDNSLKMLRRIIGEDITIDIKQENDLWSIQADATQMDQVIMNLVINARDAMPKGGELTVETKNVVLDKKHTKLRRAAKAGEYVMLKISDNGSGMSEEVQKHIFEPFFTTREVGKGTGLGLATVYGIVSQHNGGIDMTSAPEKGSTFKIFFPAVREKGEQIEDGTIKGAELPRGTETVLLVEDESMVRKFVEQALSSLGYTVLVATDGWHALDVCAEHKEQIDLLLTDVVMPKMSGGELAQKMQDQCPFINVLFMSGYTDDSYTLQSLLETEVNFLEKPFTPKSLAYAMRKVLARDDDN